MRVILFLVSASILWAKVHTAQIVPYEIYTIKAAVSGKVVRSAIEEEGKLNEGKTIIQIDDFVDQKKLQSLRQKREYLFNMIKITQQSIENARRTMQIKKKSFDRIKNLRTKSQYEKDLRESEFLVAQQNYLASTEKLQSLKTELSDVEFAMAQTQDLLAKKRIAPKGYIYAIHVKKGDFVSPGMPLLQLADISKAKVVVYLTPEEMEGIEHKLIYIDGKKSKAKFLKIIRVPDSEYITQYKAEIEVPKPKIFGKLIKVEIR
ncbi:MULTISPECIES: HlyD family secretion protein [unclassified Nitratiruptor]|uniref:HlyD family efflux transporter periplasmic adaptor subunit n=1 Tax=unclassified Nitratiruptor TaxID=2624044 RepID=UPI00191698F8|nr:MULTISPECIES: HlyD family secretion protein [unclassified Nitratiruptor]BCD60214.1 hypothetical protein NitYY0810_C0979 [Nitratiruptor sp. YY08-10]BCD64297.1 hypothetical protein NitYY0814_C1142 [Nitratiruptor sp. YY08-14]